MGELFDGKSYHDFHEGLVMAVRLPRTARALLLEFADADVRASRVARILRSNPYACDRLGELMLMQGMKEPLPSLEASIPMLGIQTVRDFVLSLQILRNVNERHPKVGKDGKFDFSPGELVGFAKKAEEAALARKAVYPELAHVAGYLFDIVVAAGRKRFGAKKTFDELAGQVFEHGLKAGAVAVELSRAPKLTLPAAGSKYAFAACLIHDVGKLALELLYPPGSPQAFASFRAMLAKRQPPDSRTWVNVEERRRFGVTHAELGASICGSFEPLRPAARAVLFHHQPYLAARFGADTRGLATLVALASNVAANARAPKGGEDPVYGRWLSHELRDLKIDKTAVADALKRVEAAGKT